jgi:hypothetical protein
MASKTKSRFFAALRMTSKTKSRFFAALRMTPENEKQILRCAQDKLRP